MMRQEIVSNELPLIPIRNRVLFPGSVVRLNIGRPKSLKVVHWLLKQNNKDHHSNIDNFDDELLIFRSTRNRKRYNFVLLSTLYTPLNNTNKDKNIKKAKLKGKKFSFPKSFLNTLRIY